MKSILILTISLAFSPIIGTGQELKAIIEENSYPLQLSKNGIQGEAFEFLLSAAEKHQYFLIGEEHGIAENGWLTAHLMHSFKSLGYDHFIAEIGPYTAKIIESFHSAPSDSLDTLLHKYPWAIPFFSLREDAMILEQLDFSQFGYQLLGLDQEFAGSFRMLFHYLRRMAVDNPSIEMANYYYEFSQACYEKAFTAGNPSESFIYKINPEDFRKLKQAFVDNSEGLDLISEIEQTVDIYKKWFIGQGYQSNFQRANLMKAHWMQYVDQSPNPDFKAVGKMGSNHFYRGLNALHIPDIGNFLSEYAQSKGQQTFHLKTVAITGRLNAYNPFNQDSSLLQKPFDITKESDHSLAEILPFIPRDQSIVIDLRPLREHLFHRRIQIDSEELRKVIRSYDGLLIFSKVQAATYF